MEEGIQYSERLGRIRDEQLAAALARFGLGDFVRAAPTTSGLFGQNVFITSTKGEFVLRGAPHWVGVVRDGELQYERDDRVQFTKEKFFARALYEQTRAPVPWPIHHDETDDIFGWPYLLMPKMPGHCFNERDILKALGADDRRGVATALGAMLAQMQRLRWPLSGGMDSDIELKPYPGGHTEQLIRQTLLSAATARRNGAFEDADQDFVERAAASARVVADQDRPHTFVHVDYKLNNLTVMKDGERWRVSGIFDLHEAHFGDGALDIVRTFCSYLDSEPHLAPVFLDSYRTRMPPDPTLRARAPLYVVNDRMKFWAFFAKAERPSWLKGNFRDFARRYLEALLEEL
jgi:aminoglycoside phosphotransferase (APT) family kinase protein